MKRRGALPSPIQESLFGHMGVVQTLDAPEHQQRKDLFMQVLRNAHGFQNVFAEEWDQVMQLKEIDVMEQSKIALLKSVLRYLGYPIPSDGELKDIAECCWTLITSFGASAPLVLPYNRHWKARRARKRLYEYLAPHVQSIREKSVNTTDHSLYTPMEQIVHAVDDDTVVMDELLNVIRPVVAIAQYIGCSVHQLHESPEWKSQVLEDNNLVLFANEVRRYYPFAPILGAISMTPFVVEDHGKSVTVSKDTLVILDLYASNHSAAQFSSPDNFDPSQLGESEAMRAIMPQGWGNPSRGHRCPGEDFTVSVIQQVVLTLARRKWYMMEPDHAYDPDSLPPKLNIRIRLF
jgi:fatty-acid peroxygenase